VSRAKPAAAPAAATPIVSPMAPLLFEPAVRRALEEDLGRAGDLTTDAVVPVGHETLAVMVSRAPGRVAGLDVAAAAFRLLDERVMVTPAVADGADVEAGRRLAGVAGPTRAILSAERVALNFLAHLSGVATVTREVVRLVEGTGAHVVCTRKTTPGLRALQKHAVRCGGGHNHRFGLDDAVLIKDNHVVVAGGVTEAVRRARRAVGHMVRIEVEVDDLEQLEEALAAGVEAILLDNMDVATLRQAVQFTAGRAVTEASGGITPATARAVAETGVDLLSVGWITHSAPAWDVALDLTAVGRRGATTADPDRGEAPAP